MRVLVIGFGSAGRRHAANALALGHDVRVMDVVPQRVYDLKPGMQFYYSQESMRADGFMPEAVVVATPAATHAMVAREIQAWYDGPLFVEKPLALSVDDAEVFRIWPCVVQAVGYNLRWQPQARALRAGLTLAGAATAARFGLACNMADWPGRQYGDPLFENSHEIDLAYCCGAPDELSAVEITDAWAKLEFGDPDHRVDLCWKAEEPRYRRAWMVESERFNGSVWFDRSEALGEQMYVDELAHFLACAKAGEATECPFADGLAVLRICEQAKAMAGATI